MKNFILILCIISICCNQALAKVDKYSADYLKNKKHFSILNPFAENIAEKYIKKSIKKDTGKNFRVKFEGYTLESMKEGIFKTLELTGKDFEIDEIPVVYLKLRNISDYNWIDYKQDPAVFKTNMTYAYEIHLNEESISKALDKKDYQKTLQKVNNLAYPLFSLRDVNTRIRNNKLYIIMDYNLPLAGNNKIRTFMASTSFNVEDGKLKAKNVGIDKSYGNLPIDKVANLINLLDPLSFTLNVMNEKKCNTKIENVKIEDNIIQINGRIFIKGE